MMTNLFNTLFNLEDGYINSNILTLNKNYLNNQFYECFDYNKLNFIVENIKEIKQKYRPNARDNVCLNKYLKSSNLEVNNRGVKTVKYFQNDDELYGRYYSKSGAQGMVREVKATIFYDNYIDIDIVNAHPCFTKWLCENLNIECPKLTEYINNRDSIFRELMDSNNVDKEFIKKCFISIMYGAKSIDGIFRKNKESDECYFQRKILKNNTQFIEDFKLEVENIYNVICDKFKKFYNISSKKKICFINQKYGDKVNKDKYNLNGTCLSHINLFIENQILTIILDYLHSRLSHTDFHRSILCFDGLMIYKDAFSEQILTDINNIFKNLNINIKIINKEMQPIDLKEFNYNENTIYSVYKKELKPEELAETIIINDEDDYSIEKKLIFHSSFADMDIADYFISINNNFIVYEETIYFFNGRYWLKCSNDIGYNYIISYLSNTIYNKLFNIIEDMDINDKFYMFLKKKISILRKISNLKSIISAIKSLITIQNDIFDKNECLITFTNGTYDLYNNIFRECKKEDYITRCLGYDYEFINESDNRMIEFKNFLSKIMPDNKELEFLLTILSTTLHSKTLEKFIILTGIGRNGKDTLMTYVMKNTLGDLYYEGSVNAITNESKNDLNVALANCDKKNCIVMNEPAVNKKLICSEIKKMTGGCNINCRGLYSSKSEVKLMNTLFMLSNEMPLIDMPDDAIFMRLIIFKFKSVFKSKNELDEMGIYKEGLHNDGLYYYYVSQYYKSFEFLNNIAKLCMINLLINAFQTFKNNNFIIENNIQSIKDEVNKHMNNSSDFMCWFNDNYYFTESKDDFIQLKDVYSNFINSYLYENLNKSDKRKCNKTWLFDKIKSSMYFKKYFKEQKYIFSNKKNYKNILIKCAIKKSDDDDFEDLAF